MIVNKLERRMGGNGDLLVYVVDEIDHSTVRMVGWHIEREVVIGGFRYEAFVYGRREAMTTKLNIPLQGIVLDGTMAIDDGPAKRIEKSEYQSRGIEL